MAEWMKKYGVVTALGVLIVSFVLFYSARGAELSAVNNRVEHLVIQLYGMNQTVSEMSEQPETSETLEVDIETNTISAHAFAEEIIELDDFLTAEYMRSSVPVERTEKEQAEHDALVQEYHTKNEQLRGITLHHETWQRNPEWTLSLETVAVYEGVENIPVVFSMETSDGDLAGFVRGIYHVDDHRISDVTYHYTVQGLDDEASLGGF